MQADYAFYFKLKQWLIFPDILIIMERSKDNFGIWTQPIFILRHKNLSALNDLINIRKRHINIPYLVVYGINE